MNRHNRRFNPLSPPFNNRQRPPNLFQELASINFDANRLQGHVDRNWNNSLGEFYQTQRRNDALSHHPVKLQGFNTGDTNTRHEVRPTSPIQFQGIPHGQFHNGRGVYDRTMSGESLRRWPVSNKSAAPYHAPNPLAGLRIPRLPSPHRRYNVGTMPANSFARYAWRQMQPLKAPVPVVSYQTNIATSLTTSKIMPNSQPLTNGGVSDESCVKHEPEHADEDSDNSVSNCSTSVLPVVGRVKVNSASLVRNGVSGGLELYSGDDTEMVKDSSGTEMENLELVLGDSDIEDWAEKQSLKSEETFETKCVVNGHEKTESGIKSISVDREMLSPFATQTIVKSEKTFDTKCDLNENAENRTKYTSEDREFLSSIALPTFQTEESFETKCDVSGHEKTENGMKSVCEDRELLSPGAMQTIESEETFEIDVNCHNKNENVVKSISEDRELLSSDATQTFRTEETFEIDVNGHDKNENVVKSISEDHELLSSDATQTFRTEETFEIDVNGHDKNENVVKSLSEGCELLSPDTMQTEESFEMKCDVNGYEETENGIESITEDRELLFPCAMQTFESEEIFETECVVNGHKGIKFVFEDCELLSPPHAMQTFQSKEIFETKCDVNSHKKAENRIKSVSEDRQLLSPDTMQTLQSEETVETKCDGNDHKKIENGVKSIFESCELFSSGAMQSFKSEETLATKCDINCHEKTENGIKSTSEDCELLSSGAMQTFQSEETKCDVNGHEKTENGVKSISEGCESLSSDVMPTHPCVINDDGFHTCTSESDEVWSNGSGIVFDDRFSESEYYNLVIDEDLIIGEEHRLIENGGEKEDEGQGTQAEKGDSDCVNVLKEAGSVEHIAQCDFNQPTSCSSSTSTLGNSESSIDVSFGQSVSIQDDEMKQEEDFSSIKPVEDIENNDVGSNSCDVNEDLDVDEMGLNAMETSHIIEEENENVCDKEQVCVEDKLDSENLAKKYDLDEGSLVLPCESSEPESQNTEDCVVKEDALVTNKDDLLDFFLTACSDRPKMKDLDNGVTIPANCGDQSNSQVSTVISHFSESNDSATDDNLFGERDTENSKSDCLFHFTESNNSVHSVEVAMEMDRSDTSGNQSMDALDVDMYSQSSDGMMTDSSENSGSIPSLDEAYVQNLITKAQLLPDNEKMGDDNNDFENVFLLSQAPSEMKYLDLKASENLSEVHQVDGDEDCREHCQNLEKYKDDFKLCHDEDEQHEEESLLDEAIPGCHDPGETFSPNSSLSIFNRNLDETDGRLWEENFVKGLKKLKTTLEHFDESQDKSCREDIIGHKECSDKNANDDGMVVEQNVDNLSSFNSGVTDMNEKHRDGSPFAVLPSEDDDLAQDDPGSCSNSEDGLHLELNMVDEPFPGHRTSTVCHDQDDASCKSSSTSTVCPEQDDISCRSSTSAECSEDLENWYSSNSTATLRSLEQGDRCSEQSVVDSSTESLTITLLSTTDPQTGKLKWVANNAARKQRIHDLEDTPTKGHVLRKSKATQSSVTRSRKKRRMIPPNNPKVLRNSGLLSDLAKKPGEDNSNHRSPKERWSIRLNDVAEKLTLPDQEDDDLHFGNIKELAELLKKVEEESHSQGKRCRSTPRKLFFAAKHGDVPQILALAASCNVNSTIPQENHKTAVHTAAANGHVQALYVLYKLGGNLSLLDCKLRPPLFDAVENNQIEVVKFLIGYKVNLTLRDSSGMTALHIAAKKCYVEIINLLMTTRKINVDEQDSGGWTSLMWTAEGRHVVAAKCLLKWGASVHILDNEVNTCLHWAALSGATDIMELLLDAKVDIDSRNKFGATALHISTRERKLNNILILEKYGPNLEIEDTEHKRAIQAQVGSGIVSGGGWFGSSIVFQDYAMLATLSSKCHAELDRMEKLFIYRKCTMTERLITNDISRGQEFRPIPCVNDVDQENLPVNFVYVHRSCEGPKISFDRISMMGCDCSEGCFNEKSCQCAQLSARKRFWYDEEGLISSDIFLEDRPLVYECNMKCKCWSSCSQRVVQRGMNVSLQLYKTKHKGWAVRTLALIPKGAFVCEYVGEILTDEEADKRDDDCYLFDLDVKGNSNLFCLDAKFYGNVSRFVNHSCVPNVLPVRVFTDHQVKSCPRIAFFASREIHPYEEVCSDYGERFWKVKKSEFDCACNTPKCRYKASVY